MLSMLLPLLMLLMLLTLLALLRVLTLLALLRVLTELAPLLVSPLSLPSPLKRLNAEATLSTAKPMASVFLPMVLCFFMGTIEGEIQAG